MTSPKPSTSSAFHDFGDPPATLSFGTPLRVLDAGMRKPVLYQLDGPDGPASWVVKAPHKERRGVTGLVCEIVGSELAAWLGLPTPAIGIVRIPAEPPGTDETDVGRAARDIYVGSAGRIAFCSRYLDHAPPLRSGDLDDLRSVPATAQEDAIRLLVLDAWLRHYDRTPNNANALALEDRLVAIDHGLSLFHLGAVDESGATLEPDTFSEPTLLVRHIAARLASKRLELPIWAELAARVRALDDGRIGAMLSRVPDELDRGLDGRPFGMKSQAAAFLRARRDAIDTILESVRACLPR